MKLFLLFLCLSTSIFAQDFTSIKSKTDKYPSLLTSDNLVKKIKKDFSSKENQTKAIFAWLTQNIRYDLEEFYNPKSKRTKFRYRTEQEKEEILQAIKDVRVMETLETNKGVCEGYAQTFAKICTLLEIENEVIKGYARASYLDINKPIQRPNHAWNAVKLNGKWIYIDATWGAGHTNNGEWLRDFKPYYFNINKETYFKSHLPDESIWRLRVERMDKNTFYNQPIYSHHFLTSNYKLLNTSSGILKRGRNGKINVSIKNVTPNQKIHFGVIGEKYAKQAEVTHKNGITSASIIIPQNAKYISLLVDLKMMVNFKIM